MLDGAMPNEPEDILHGLGNTVSYTTSNRPTFRKLKRKLEILALLKFPIFAYLRQGGDVLADQLLTTERLLSELRIKIPDEGPTTEGLHGSHLLAQHLWMMREQGAMIETLSESELRFLTSAFIGPRSRHLGAPRECVAELASLAAEGRFPARPRGLRNALELLPKEAMSMLPNDALERLKRRLLLLEKMNLPLFASSLPGAREGPVEQGDIDARLRRALGHLRTAPAPPPAASPPRRSVAAQPEVGASPELHRRDDTDRGRQRLRNQPRRFYGELSPERHGRVVPQDASPSVAAAHVAGLPWAEELLLQGDVTIALDDIDLLPAFGDFFDADDHFAIPPQEAFGADHSADSPPPLSVEAAARDESFR